MAYRQETTVDGRCFRLETSFDWGTTRICTRAYLVLIYINDLEEGVTSKIFKFSDDTKLFRKNKVNGDKQQLQDDIDKLIKWSEKWQMLFKFEKCKCLNTGLGITGLNYDMGGTVLCKIVKEKDSGVAINANIRVSEQCRIAASEGNQIIGTRCKYFDPCYARATVVRARFLAAAFSDGSYLAHVNGAYLRHVTFCIVRGPPLFIISPICQRGSRAAAHLTCRGTPASPILAVM